MNESYEVIARDGALRLFKEDPHWERERLVRVAAPGIASHTLRFEATQDVLDIVDLPLWAEVTLSVQDARPLRRLLKRPVELRARPRARRLRGLVTGSGRCGTSRWPTGSTA
ncbi:MAG: hypothetical protein IPH09_12500 [bacterium]|nr:hypothetical protein [bacterium]